MRKNACYLSVASNYRYQISNENPIVSSPLVTVENLPKIEVDNKKYDDLSNKNLHNESSVSNSKYLMTSKPMKALFHVKHLEEGEYSDRLSKRKRRKKLH